MKSALIAALRAMLEAKSFRHLAADLEFFGGDLGGQRISLRGADRHVDVDVSGPSPLSPFPTAGGRWEGEATVEDVVGAVKACLLVDFALARPLPPGKTGWVLHLQAGEASHRTLLIPAELKGLLPAFEKLLAGTTPVAAMALEVEVAAGTPWKGVAHLRALGREPVVVLHPAGMMARKQLLLERRAETTKLTADPGPLWLVLAPGAVFSQAFEANPLAGDGPVNLRWSHGMPSVAPARLGAYRLVEANIVSPVAVLQPPPAQ
jgi:hypothetical protein